MEDQVNLFLKEIREKGVAENTISSKKRHLFVFLEFLKEIDVLDFSTFSIDNDYLDKFKLFLTKRNLKKSTQDSYLSTVLSFLKYMNIPGFNEKKEREETDVQKIVNYYFEKKGYSIEEIKDNAKKKKIIYSRYTKPAKDLLHLAGSLSNSKKAIDKVAAWASSRNLDYAIETVFKKWPEINNLKPKEKKKKAYYRDDPMMWSNTKQKWFVISRNGDWLEFAGDEKDIEWREE